MKTNPFPMFCNIDVTDEKSIEKVFECITRDPRVPDRENIHLYLDNDIVVRNQKGDFGIFLETVKKVNFYNRDSWPHHAKRLKDNIELHLEFENLPDYYDEEIEK